jgi:hypothetical protein
MKVYVASFFDTRVRIRPYADALWHKGYQVVSTWLNEVAKPENITQEEFWKKLAVKDLTEVKEAELLILDTLDVTPRGGREVEFGFALGAFQNKAVYLVGPVRNIFHTLVDRKFESWDALILALPDVKKDSVNPSPSV